MRHRFSSSSVALAALIALGLGAAVPARADMTFSSGTTTINFAIVGTVFVTDSAVVNLVAGGSISGDVDAFDTSTVNVFGGSIGGNVQAVNSSTVNVSGGTIGGSLVAVSSSTVNVFGGTIGGSLQAGQSGTINVYGCNLALLGGVLTGTLLDGTAVNNPVVTGSGGQVVLFAGFPGALAVLNQMRTAGAISATAANLISGELQMARAGFNVCPNLRCALCLVQSAEAANRPGAAVLGRLLEGLIRCLLGGAGC